MPTDNWEVISQMLGSMKMYIVGRQRDTSPPYAGYIEYAPDAHFTTDEAKAKKLAEEMNKIEG